MKIFLKILTFIFKNGIYLSIYGTKQNEKIVVMASKTSLDVALKFHMRSLIYSMQMK